MRVETYVCDECGVQKKGANHWFLVDIGAQGFKIFPWVDGADTYKHICGESCLLKSIAQWAGKLVAA